MRRQILQPLGMTGTTPDSATEQIPDRVAFYYPRLSGDPHFWFVPAARGDYSGFAGAGGFLSSPSDLVRFGLALNRGTLLQAATVRMLQTPQLLASGEETEYGLGWMLETLSLAGVPPRSWRAMPAEPYWVAPRRS
jgi:serine beta-lactamase-like protein LACTB